MEEKTFFNKIIESLAIKRSITLLGIVGAFVTIYAYLEEKKVDLRCEIISSTNVLDVKADIGKLDIIYDSTNLKQTNENLRIYTVKIINNGNKDILKDNYDSNDPVGIKISKGQIIDNPELITTSNEYLHKNVRFTKEGTGVLFFSEVIIEKGEYFVVKLLLLHKNDTLPQIKAIGKIAGQKEIDVVDMVGVKEELNYFESLFKGNFWVQVGRGLMYLIFWVLVLLAWVRTSEKIDTIKARRKRKRKIKQFKESSMYKYKKTDDSFFQRYEKSEDVYLEILKQLISNSVKLNLFYLKVKKESFNENEYIYPDGYELDINFYKKRADWWLLIKGMIEDKIVVEDEGRLVIAPSIKKTIDSFSEFVTKM